MRVLVCGGRDYDNGAKVFNVLSFLRPDVTIVHGCATGVDRLAGLWAAEFGVDCEEFPAEWERYGPSAGPIRNKRMLSSGIDLVIAFPGGKGTADMTNRAIMAGIPTLRVE